MSDKQDQQSSADFTTAAQDAGILPPPPPVQGHAQNGLPPVYGLQPVPNSRVPGMAGGREIDIVYGPGQNAADPIAAGIPLQYIGVEAPNARVVTQTGEVGAGTAPFTHIQYTGPEMVPQRAPADNSTVRPEAPQQPRPEGLKPAPQPKSKVSDQPLPSGAASQAGGPTSAPGPEAGKPAQVAPGAAPAQTGPAPAPAAKPAS